MKEEIIEHKGRKLRFIEVFDEENGKKTKEMG